MRAVAGPYPGRVLDVGEWPELKNPVLVYSFRGWIDAGLAGEGTMELLIDQLVANGGRRFGTIHLTDLLDLQQTRPTVKLIDGGLRSIEWPEVQLWAGNLGRDIVCIRGPEPSLRWPEFASWIADIAERTGAKEAFAAGGMPGVVTHRRSVPVLSSATKRSVAQEVGPTRDDYVGATGLNTVVQHTLGERGVRSVALWAQVPQYVSGSPSPPAVRSVVGRLIDLGRISVELGALDERCAAYRDKVEEGLSERPDVLSIVNQIDEQWVERIPSGDELATEIERFLRDQGDS